MGKGQPPVSNSSSRIEEIRRRADAAIRGPWFWGGNTESNTVHLATADRGRLFLLDTAVRHETYVFDHDECEAYTVEEIRERFTVDLKLIAPKPYMDMDDEELKALCDARGLAVSASNSEDGVTASDYWNAIEEYDQKHGTDPDNWWCSAEGQAAWRNFIDREIDTAEGRRDFVPPDAIFATFTMGVQAFPELRFAGNVPQGAKDGRGEPWDRHKVGGYKMVSYRDIARYAVLDGRTVEEHEAAGGTIDGEPRNLYREDIVGLDNPEAEFIAHSRDDVDFLLDLLDRTRAALAGVVNLYREPDGSEIVVKEGASDADDALIAAIKELNS